MADQLRRSDRSDQNRYGNLDKPANQKQQPVRSPGWTKYGDMVSQQMAALKYNKAAQEHKQQQAANANAPKEQESKKEAYYRQMSEKLATTQKDRGSEQARQQQQTRTRDMDQSR